MGDFLEPLPAPGLAVFPEFVSDKATTLIVKGEFFSSSCEITYADDKRPFIYVDREIMSMSHRKHIVHVPTNSELAEFQKEKFAMRSHYYATNPQRGRLLDASTQFSLGGAKWQVEFGNAAAGGKPEMLDAKSHAFSFDTEVKWQGRIIAVVERKAFSMRGETHLHIAPGLDPFIIVMLVMAIADRRRSNNAAAGGGGGGGA